MPVISLDTMNKILPLEQQKSIADSVFGPEPSALDKAQAMRDASFQDWINTRKQTINQQRTDDVRLARVNALGNLLTTMVQPIGWAIGGKGSGVTGGVQPYDNRQYLEAFNRAVKASEDLRNIGNIESEYRFKVAEDAYQRELAQDAFDRRQQAELEKQKQIYDMRSQLNQEQIEGRIKVEEAKAKAKFQFKQGNTRVAESVRDNLIKRANTAYANILSDYYKKKQVGIENLQEPPTYDEFLKKFASENGYQVAESQNAKQKDDNPYVNQNVKVGGFQGVGSTAVSTQTEKKGGFVR